MKWVKKLWGGLLALAALFFAWQSFKHREKQSELEKKAAEADAAKVQGVAEAKRHHGKAEAHAAKAEAALNRGKATIEKLEKHGNESLADRVRKFNSKL